MNPNDYFGFGAIYSLKKIVRNLKAKKLFLVTGKSSFELSGARKIFFELFHEHEIVEFSDSSSVTSYNTLLNGISYFKKHPSDVVIAVGGGRIIDMAKLITYFGFQQQPPIDYIMGKHFVKRNSLPLIAVPTTSGTGSESTKFAVLYIDGTKYSVEDNDILPNYSIVDPNLSFSVPRRVAASSGMDALCQAIESYWSVNSTDESKSYSLRALQLSLNNLEKAVNEKIKESIEAMSLAAHLAGKAINITHTTAPHALSYNLTSKFGIPHGEAVAMIIGEVLIMNNSVTRKNVTDSRGVEYVQKTVDRIIKLLKCQTSFEAKERLKTLFCNIGLRDKMSDYGVNKSDIRILVNSVNLKRIRNNPRKLSKREIKNIFENIL